MAGFSWGALRQEPLEYGELLPANSTLGQLFLIRRSVIEFPLRDVRIMPLHGITAVGWLNPGPIFHDALATSGLVSADGLSVVCKARLELRLRTGKSRELVVRSREAVETDIELAFTTAIQEILRRFSYADIHNGVEAVTRAALARVREVFSDDTAYDIGGCIFHFQARDQSVAAGFELASGRVALDRAEAEARRVETASTQRQQEAEARALTHSLNLSAEKAQADLDQDLAAFKARQQAELDALVARREAFGSALEAAQYLNPEAAVALAKQKILAEAAHERAEAARQFERAFYRGRFKGIGDMNPSVAKDSLLFWEGDTPPTDDETADSKAEGDQPQGDGSPGSKS